MEASDRSMSPESDQEPLTSYLPLLFAGGFPRSLDELTAQQLQRFIPFMLKCSLNYKTDNLKTAPKPEWWPPDVSYSQTFLSSSKTDKLEDMKAVVRSCYAYYDCNILLKYSSDLAKYPRLDLRFQHNADGTTTLTVKATGKLLVTFLEENRIYDQSNDNSHQCLLPNNVSTSSSNARIQHVTVDIFLCEYCPAEFTTLEEVQEHERKFCTQKLINESSPTLSEGGYQQIDKVLFMSKFSLQPSSRKKNKASEINRSKTSVKNSTEMTVSTFPDIPFSSPLGKSLKAKTKRAMVKFHGQTHRYEMYVNKPVRCSRSRKVGGNQWRVTWTQSSKMRDLWDHLYSFTQRQLKRKILSIMTGLDIGQVHKILKEDKLYVILKESTVDAVAHYLIRRPAEEDVELKIVADIPAFAPKVTPCTPLGTGVCHRNNTLPVPLRTINSYFNMFPDSRNELDHISIIPVVDLCSSDDDDDDGDEPSTNCSTQILPVCQRGYAIC